MTTFHFALELVTSDMNRSYWRLPSIVRFGSLITARQAGSTVLVRPVDGSTAPNVFLTPCGAVGARSGAFVVGLSQAPLAEAFASRKERRSRKKTSRFLPQRNVR